MSKMMTAWYRAAFKLAKRGCGVSVCFAVCGGASNPQSAFAQDAQSAGPVFQATVQDMSSRLGRVQVPLNRSVVVDSTVEVTRVDVVNPTIADVQIISPKQLLVTANRYGTTNVVLWGAKDQQFILEVGVELDLQSLNTSLKSLDPQSNVEARSVLGNIVLIGTVSSAQVSQRMQELSSLFISNSAAGGTGPLLVVQNHLDVAGEQQVLLRCVVAEVTRSAARELGMNGFLAGENFKDAFVVNQIGGINPINIGAAADAPVTSNVPFLTGENGIPLSPSTALSLGFPRAQMQLFINAMSDNGLLKVLAEPNLVAISGETATFLAGGEFPVPVPQGNQTVTIEFRPFGVRLNFTPIIRGQQLIRLRVKPEVSELDFSTAIQIQGLSVPGLSSRSAETTVEVGNGQTLAIAGLLSEQVRGVATRVPGVGDLPVLGALFRSVEFRRSMTELVILVTPEIVAPLEPHQVGKLPGEDFADPTDFEFYANGWLEGKYARADERARREGGEASANLLPSEPDKKTLHGPWGYASAN